jgi:hypothetical protein
MTAPRGITERLAILFRLTVACLLSVNRTDEPL